MIWISAIDTHVLILTTVVNRVKPKRLYHILRFNVNLKFRLVIQKEKTFWVTNKKYLSIIFWFFRSWLLNELILNSSKSTPPLWLSQSYIWQNLATPFSSLSSVASCNCSLSFSFEFLSEWLAEDICWLMWCNVSVLCLVCPLL